MKKNILLFTFSALIALSCNNTHKDNDDRGHGHGGSDMHEYISVDSANKMLSSYLNSIKNNDSDLHSITIDADQLRSYLDDKDVKKIKIMLSHKLDYINSGNGNVNCGYNIKGLTFIIAGYDSSNNYVFNQGMVLDLGTPCPYSCPTNGTASNDLLSINSHHK